MILLNAQYSSIYIFFAFFKFLIQVVGRFSLTPESKTSLEVNFSGLLQEIRGLTVSSSGIFRFGPVGWIEYKYTDLSGIGLNLH